MRLNPDTGLPESSPDTSQRGYGLHWRTRERRSRLIKEPVQALDRDEMLDRNMCVAGLRRFWYQLPKGSKRALARHLNMQAAHLRGIVTKMRSGLPEAYRRRISRFLMRHARGEMILREVSPNASPRSLWIAGKPSHEWIYEPASSPRLIEPQWFQALESEAKSIVFHAPNERLLA